MTFEEALERLRVAEAHAREAREQMDRKRFPKK